MKTIVCSFAFIAVTFIILLGSCKKDELIDNPSSNSTNIRITKMSCFINGTYWESGIPPFSGIEVWADNNYGQFLELNGDDYLSDTNSYIYFKIYNFSGCGTYYENANNLFFFDKFPNRYMSIDSLPSSCTISEWSYNAGDYDKIRGTFEITLIDTSSLEIIEITNGKIYTETINH